MTKEEFAALLNGRDYGDEIAHAEEKLARESGLLVIVGSSDDLVEIYGVEREELGAYEGLQFSVDAKGTVRRPNIEWEGEITDEDEETLATYFQRKQVAKPIQARWCADDSEWTWSFKTDIPHSTFDIVDEGEKFCRGIVIDTKDLLPPIAESDNELTHTKAAIAKLEKNLLQLGRIADRNIVTMQATWIEWKNGKGAEAALEWIENTLDGPGLIPSVNDEHYTDAQKYFDANAPDYGT
ncbi:hypothetical protein [Undibacterium sp. TJN19]|uniref:hypothetical protein n=1 Tax=Undibacterium sp. TJN19 TaxID=3413055 RepID=UPI003BF20151